MGLFNSPRENPEKYKPLKAGSGAKVSLIADSRKKPNTLLQGCGNLITIGALSAALGGLIYAGYDEYYGEQPATPETKYKTSPQKDSTTIDLFDALQGSDSSE